MIGGRAWFTQTPRWIATIFRSVLLLLLLLLLLLSAWCCTQRRSTFPPNGE
jgi:hypothetical protein